MTRNPDRGNFVSEWFGYRTYPHVHGSPGALRTQTEGQCPFLTTATREKRECVKNASSSGVCTINNASNGIRQDWLVCPYRALDPDLIEDVVRRLLEQHQVILCWSCRRPRLPDRPCELKSPNTPTAARWLSSTFRTSSAEKSR